MSSFAVNPDSLNTLSSAITGIATEVVDLPSLSPTLGGQMGDPGLESAVQDFLKAWHNGMVTIGKNIGEAAQRVEFAAYSYWLAEQHTTAVFSKTGTTPRQIMQLGTNS